VRAKGARPNNRTGPPGSGLLIFLLALFGGVRAGSCGLGFGFLLARIALGVGLVLLSLARWHLGRSRRSPHQTPRPASRLDSAGNVRVIT